MRIHEAVITHINAFQLLLNPNQNTVWKKKSPAHVSQMIRKPWRTVNMCCFNSAFSIFCHHQMQCAFFIPEVCRRYKEKMALSLIEYNYPSPCIFNLQPSELVTVHQTHLTVPSVGWCSHSILSVYLQSMGHMEKWRGSSFNTTDFNISVPWAKRLNVLYTLAPDWIVCHLSEHSKQTVLVEGEQAVWSSSVTKWYRETKECRLYCERKTNQMPGEAYSSHRCCLIVI